MTDDDIVSRLRSYSSLATDGVPLYNEAANEIERLRAALESLTKDPPSTLAREHDEDWEVVVKMKQIARDALRKEGTQ